MIENLLNTPVPPAPKQRGGGWSFTQEYDPRDRNTVNITATTSEKLQDDQAIRDFITANGGIIPDGYTARLVEARHNTSAWHRDTPDEAAVTRGAWFYRFTIEPVTPSRQTVIDELVAIIGSKRPPKSSTNTTDTVFHFLAGDLQLGKMDGDGTKGIINTYLQSVDTAVQRWRKLGRPQVHIAWLGDCIEGNQSQNGRTFWRTELTVTEQTRIMRRLLLHTIDAFITAPNISLDVVNGNHDQVQRFQETRADDGHATEAAIAVSEAITMSERYNHVKIYVPGVDETYICRTIGTTTFVLLHGHQFSRGKAMDWWASQSFNGHSPSQAHILVHGHEHEFSIKSRKDRLVICTPTLESESTWWKHKTGDQSKRGSIIMTSLDGEFANLEIV